MWWVHARSKLHAVTVDVANRDLFEEQVDIIFKAFNNESFSHQGTYYTLPPRVPYRGYELTELTLVPRPLRRPVECWQPIQGGSERALDFMAKHGIQGMIGGGSADGGAMHNVVLKWQEAQLPLSGRLKISPWVQHIQLGVVQRLSNRYTMGGQH